MPKFGIERIAQFMVTALALSNEKEAYIWVYRMSIAVLLSILSTLFLADRFLPYPWLEDKATVMTAIKSIEAKTEMNRIRLEALQQQLRELDLRLGRIERESKRNSSR